MPTSEPPQSVFRVLHTGGLMSNPSCKGFALLCSLLIAGMSFHFNLVGHTNTADLWWEGLKDELSGDDNTHRINPPLPGTCNR